jgi:membrane-associated protease RseP (regulator of RpoE activity)
LVALISAGIPNYFAEDGIAIDRIVSDSPSDGVLKEGMVLEAIDNHKINDSDSYVNVVSLYKPGDNVTVQTDQGSYSLTLDKNPNNESRGFFGIQANKHFELINDSMGPIPWVLFELLELFQWVFMLNLGIGLFNLLPLKPLDGGYMLEILLSYKLSEEHYKPIVNALSVVMAMIIIFSIVVGFI